MSDFFFLLNTNKVGSKDRHSSVYFSDISFLFGLLQAKLDVIVSMLMQLTCSGVETFFFFYML